jgi:hypothetical protein
MYVYLITIADRDRQNWHASVSYSLSPSCGVPAAPGSTPAIPEVLAFWISKNSLPRISWGFFFRDGSPVAFLYPLLVLLSVTERERG